MAERLLLPRKTPSRDCNSQVPLKHGGTWASRNTGGAIDRLLPVALARLPHALSSPIPLVWLQHGGSTGPRNPLLSVPPRIRPLSGDTSKFSPVRKCSGLESSVIFSRAFFASCYRQVVLQSWVAIRATRSTANGTHILGRDHGDYGWKILVRHYGIPLRPNQSCRMGEGKATTRRRILTES